MPSSLILLRATQLVSPDNDAKHRDVIEGQGGVFHPGYCAVSAGLLTGSQPDWSVVCTQANRTHIQGWEHFRLPSIEAVIERTSALGGQVNPDIRCAGISVNTPHLCETERLVYLADLSTMHSLPAVNPLLDGVGALLISWGLAEA